MKTKAAVELAAKAVARKGNLTPEELSAIGKRAARMRWKKERAAHAEKPKEG